MYFTKNEIIVFSTLLAYLLLGGLVSIIIFIAGFIYLQFINKKMRYHFMRNDSQDAMLLEGGTSILKPKTIKFGLIIILWGLVWYFYESAERQFTEIFAKGNIRYEEIFIVNFIDFWVFLILLATAILTLDIAYRLFNSSVNSDAYSKREIMLVGTFLIEAISGIYYFYHWVKIGDHTQILDSNMVSIVVYIVIFSAVAGSVLSLIIYGKNDEDAKDERDLIIEVKSYRYGFYAITTFISLLIGQMVVNHLWGSDKFTDLTLPIIANLLLMIIILAWAVVSAVQLFFYRRGY